MYFRSPNFEFQINYLPLFYSHIINDTTRLAVWHITETEDFFLEKVSVSRNITHPHKRLQHLAGRYLLQYLFPDFPMNLIQIADTRRPYLENESHHFSISHCGAYAAAIVSTTKRVGIDIEIPNERINKIYHKFLSLSETEMLQSDLCDKSNIEKLTIAWCAKEAMYKWYGEGLIDFKDHLHLMLLQEDGKMLASISKEDEIPLTINYQFISPLVLAWVF